MVFSFWQFGMPPVFSSPISPGGRLPGGGQRVVATASITPPFTTGSQTGDVFLSDFTGVLWMPST
jgi:hypothetical protein